MSPLVSSETPVWPGDQPLRVSWLGRLAAGDATNLSAITLSPHLGAHVDAPWHFRDGGADVVALGLAPFLGSAWVADVSAARDANGAIPKSALEAIAARGERRLLLRTRRTASDPARPLSAEAAEHLARSDLLLLGIDGPSVDWPEEVALPNHRRLADAGVALLVGLELGPAPVGRVELVALPLPIAGLEASPVRAVLRSLPAAPSS